MPRKQKAFELLTEIFGKAIPGKVLAEGMGDDYRFKSIEELRTICVAYALKDYRRMRDAELATYERLKQKFG